MTNKYRPSLLLKVLEHHAFVFKILFEIFLKQDLYKCRNGMCTVLLKIKTGSGEIGELVSSWKHKEGETQDGSELWENSIPAEGFDFTAENGHLELMSLLKIQVTTS